MKILITGGKGQLGYELKKQTLKYKNFDWLFTNRQSFNLSILENINLFLDKSNPDIIINCAAYTSVDNAETDIKTANTINHKAVESLAKWSNKNKCKLVHISTDYVFSGDSELPYVETDQANPLNNYGKFKLLGDIACQKNNPSSIILRTGWLYSSFGNNFLTNMIKLMQKKDKIEVVNDQFGSPTFAGDLANIILNIIITKKWSPGIYNFTNRGNVSWFDFANEIKFIFGFDTVIKPISSKEYFKKTKRPKYSLLDNSKIINTFKIKQVDYKVSLKGALKF
jgi:dTDP-4-dehydrorhamnose reductase